jgi:hypothetical protein
MIKKILSTFVLSTFVFTQQVQAETIHTFIFTDTNNSRIGSILKSDGELVEKTFSKISKIIGYKSNVQKYTESNFSLSSLEDVLNKKTQEIKDGDVVVFFVSSMGENKGGDFPSIDFNKKYKKIEDIHKTLLKTKAKLKLTISDCSNIATDNTTDISGDSNINFVKENLTKLFVKSKGDAIITSSEKNKHSFVARELGYSIFTKEFITSLENVSAKKNKREQVSWEYVFQKAKENTNITSMELQSVEQNPYWVSNITEDNNSK